jgi:metal-sulfur cluster biosynthetic enzyme
LAKKAHYGNKNEYCCLFHVLAKLSQKLEIFAKISPASINFARVFNFLTKTSKMTEAEVLKALSNVQEPDLGKDLVTLNMIQDLKIDGNNVGFTIVLTTPACPMKDMMKNACENAIKLLVNKEAIITVGFTSNTSTTRKVDDTILSKVKNIIAVVVREV